MTALIPVTDRTINDSLIPTVDARELHHFLGSKRRFTDWIKERIDLYDFIERADYAIHKNVTQYNQVDTIDYFISLDMAKEICMVERNEKGKQARLYFIECEKRLRGLQIPDPQPPEIQLAHAILLAGKMIEEQKQQLAVLAPKAAVYDVAMSSKDLLSIKDVANIINKPGLGQNKLFAFLEGKEVFYRDGGSRYMPYRAQLNAGRFRVVEQTYGDGDVHINRKILVTQKGFDYIFGLVTGGEA